MIDWSTKTIPNLLHDLDTDIDRGLSSDEAAKRLTQNGQNIPVGKSFIGESEFQLIEALAEESVKLIFEKFNVNYIKGRFSKPGAVTGSKEVGVIIERYRDST